MIEKLFSRDVVTVVATPEMWSEELHPKEAVFVRNAVAKRRREFAAGRCCARKALRILGVDENPLLVGQHREPLWPRGIVGSLTHCDGYCAAAVAREGQVVGLGVDAEVNEELNLELIPLVCRPPEIDWIRRNRALRHADWHKVIFSAKESVYKCLFPFVRRVMDYQEVEIQFHPPTNRFTVRLVFDAPNALASLPAACGRFGTAPDHIVTGVTIQVPAA